MRKNINIPDERLESYEKMARDRNVSLNTLIIYLLDRELDIDANRFKYMQTDKLAVLISEIEKSISGVENIKGKLRAFKDEIRN